LDSEKPRILSAYDDYSAAASPLFRAGAVIAYPTETFYGLCVDPFNTKAIEALYELKGRPALSPIPLIIGDAGMLDRIVTDIPLTARKLIERFWPGPLTLVFKASPALPPMLTSATGTIGVRLSGSPYARRLSCALSSPITSTSANPTGMPPAKSPKEVLGYFDGRIGLLIDGGRLTALKGSTIIDVTRDSLEIIREGEIPSSEILSL